MGQYGLVFGALIPNFGGLAAWELNHNPPVALAQALKLNDLAPADQVLAAMGLDSAGHHGRVFGVALGIGDSQLPDDVGFCHSGSALLVK